MLRLAHCKNTSCCKGYAEYDYNISSSKGWANGGGKPELRDVFEVDCSQRISACHAASLYPFGRLERLFLGERMRKIKKLAYLERVYH